MHTSRTSRTSRISPWLVALATSVCSTLALAADPAPAPAAASTPGAARPAERFKALDTNGDGKLSREEVQAAPGLAARFDEIDADKDGQITQREFLAYHRAHPMAGSGGRGMGGAFAKLDRNGDGFLSKDEVASRPRLAAQFDALDTDHDGKLSPAELAALRKAP